MNVDALKNFEAFIQVAQHGSLAAAAKATGRARQSLRARLSDFEKLVGAEVLERASVGGELTPTGTILFKHGTSLFDELRGVIEHAPQHQPSGANLTIAVPIGLPDRAALSALEFLVSAFPDLRIREIQSADPAAELLAGADLSVCLSSSVPKGPWTSFRLLSVKQQLFASRAYLGEHGMPQSPEDLRNHSLLMWDIAHLDPNILPVPGRPALRIQPVVLTSDDRRLRALANDGKGIAFVPNVPGPYVDFLDLIPVLHDTVYRKLAARLLVPNSLTRLKRARVMLTLAKRMAAISLKGLFRLQTA